jgi:hypothetical protein
MVSDMPYDEVHTITGLYVWKYITYGTSTKKSIRYHQAGRIKEYGNTIGNTVAKRTVKYGEIVDAE